MSAASNPVQTGRLLTLTSTLGSDTLIGTRLEGTEGLSELFQFTVQATSTNTSVTADQLLGNDFTVAISRPGGDPRYVNGIVTGFRGGDQTVNGMRRYEILVAPKLWLLTQTSDCRIFQSQTVVQIAETLLSDGGISAYKTQGLTGTHPSRDFCVQYNETDYDFLRRILAEEGIYFYFEHTSSSHTLVLSDSTSGYEDCADSSVVHAPPTQSQTIGVHEWRNGAYFQSGKSTLSDYDFEQPTTDLTSSTSTVVDNSAFKQWELYHYPGDYTDTSTGSDLSQTRMETVEADYAVVEGTSLYAGFTPGTKFTMSSHEVSSEEGQSYVLRTVEHLAQDLTHLGSPAKDAEERAREPAYRNRFTALPSSTSYRPPQSTRRPLIPGPQTALVVGPSGEEIYCDQYGRIRVQFHWDRLGTDDENSSCWIRVAQTLAGSGWGTQFIPRVGMEVLVAFLNGDPDRPLVVGSVYNADNMPPYTLPDNKTQSGIKTRSSTGGSSSTFNELRFEDKEGSELVYMFAQKDFTREVTNDDTLTVNNNQTITVKNDRTETVQEGNESVTISKGNRDTTVSEGNNTLTVSQGNHTCTVSQGNYDCTISQGNYSCSLGSGNHSVTLDSGDATLTCDGGSITLEAASSLTLKVGSNSVTLSQSGVSISGTQVTVSGDAKVAVSGSMVSVSGDGTVEIEGGMVSIN